MNACEKYTYVDKYNIFYSLYRSHHVTHMIHFTFNTFESKVKTEMEIPTIEQIIHFKGFSTCPKCTGRFRTTEHPRECCMYHENVAQHEIKILFRIGDHPDCFEIFKNFIDEFNQPRTKPRCCLLNDVISISLMMEIPGHRFATELAPEYGQSLFCTTPLQTLIVSEFNYRHLPIGRAEGGESISQCPIQREMQHTKDQEINGEQALVNSALTISNSAATIATKPRKSNRSRKASKKRRIKNSF